MSTIICDLTKHNPMTDNVSMDIKRIVAGLNQYTLVELERRCKKAKVPYATALKVRHGTTGNPTLRTLNGLQRVLNGR